MSSSNFSPRALVTIQPSHSVCTGSHPPRWARQSDSCSPVLRTQPALTVQLTEVELTESCCRLEFDPVGGLTAPRHLTPNPIRFNGLTMVRRPVPSQPACRWSFQLVQPHTDSNGFGPHVCIRVGYLSSFSLSPSSSCLSFGPLHLPLFLAEIEVSFCSL